MVRWMNDVSFFLDLLSCGLGLVSFFLHLDFNKVCFSFLLYLDPHLWSCCTTKFILENKKVFILMDRLTKEGVGG